MHIRANQLDIFSAACTFDAAGTLAGAALDHIERIGADVPGILVVLRRLMGVSYRAGARRRTRRDGRYWCFDLPDGSVVAVDVQQRPGAWLVCVESRTAWELLQRADDWSPVPCALWAEEISGALTRVA